MPASVPPVLITAFNRPDSITGVLRALAHHAPARLYVACDGPRAHVEGEAERIAEVRRILLSPPWPCEVRTRFLDENQGCGRAMSGAISWFFEHEERGIVLEDDCEPAPDFVPFCAELLEHHAGDARVMSILGTRHARARPTQETSYTYSRLFAPWGWASWRRAWSRFELDVRDWRRDFGPAGLASRGLAPASVREWSKKIDWPASRGATPPAWAYQWLYAHLRHDGFCVLPKVNLVSNTGFGDHATHTAKTSVWANLPTGRIEFPLVHPADVTQDREADELRERFQLNHRPWLARKLWHIRSNLGLLSIPQARGW